MKRFLSAVEATAGFFLLLIALLTFGTVILRYFFAAAIPDWFDLSKLLQGIALLWGIACACWRNEHICVDIVWEHLDTANQRRMDIVASLIVFVFLALMAWMLGAKVWQTLNSSQATSDLRMPIGPFHAVAWVGTVMAALLSFMRVIRLVRRLPDPSDSAVTGETING